MANLCSYDLEISGSNETLRKVVEEIKKDQGPLEAPQYSSDLIINCQDAQDFSWDGQDEATSITVSSASKWGPPEEWLEKLTETFPDIEITGNYEEGGNDVYGTLSACKGRVSFEDMGAEEYLSEYNEGFIEEREMFESPESIEANYNDIVKTLENEQVYHHLNEPLYVKALKPKDLPKFINHNWWTSESEDLLTERLANHQE